MIDMITDSVKLTVDAYGEWHQLLEQGRGAMHMPDDTPTERARTGMALTSSKHASARGHRQGT